MKRGKAGASCCTQSDPCEPVCAGLECFERPRFYGGQLLTERELNGLTEYFLAKNRLHNLHLHGWGVVCGLGVVCHPCEGWVTVETGYAIDPCGNDLVVCEPHDVHVAEVIRQCKKTRWRLDCERPAQRKERDEIEHWCLTIRYDEQAARPKQVLKEERRPRGSCGCGCGGHGGSCQCGGKGASSHGSSSSAASCDAQGPPCEPTRILESYRLELCESSEDACQSHPTAGEQAWIDRFTECFTSLQRRFVDRFPRQDAAVLTDYTANDWQVSTGFRQDSFELSAVQVNDAFCRVKDFLREVLERDPAAAHCTLLEELEKIECPPPTPNPDSTPLPGATGVPGNVDGITYWQTSARQPTRALWGILVRYLLDCVCHALLPPCAPCCDDEVLVLACMRVQNGKILDICNHSCRRQAGAFPPSLGGIYLGPLMPLILKLLGPLCCGDLVDRLIGRLDTSGGFRQSAQFLAADQAARPRFVFNQAQGFDLGDLFAGSPEPQGQSFNAVAFVEQPVAGVRSAAAALEIEIEEREVERLPKLRALTALAPVGRGERLVAFTREGKVLGFARAGSGEAAAVEQADEIHRLRSELTALKRSMGQGASAAKGKGSRKKER